MIIEIKVAGRYSKFGRDMKIKAQDLEAGHVARFPEEYAKSLIAAGLAEEYVPAPASQDTDPAPLAPEKPVVKKKGKK